MSSHSEGVQKGLFCAKRTKPGQSCKCNQDNDYYSNCEPSPPWPKYPEIQRTVDEAREQRQETEKAKYPARNKKGKALKRRNWRPHITDVKTSWRSHQAHHLLCVASVTKIIAEVVIKEVIDQTDWCINNKKNMIALPMWGQTIRWYCTSFGELRRNMRPPRFKNLPMHDSDHDAYIEEVDEELQYIANGIEKNKKAHKQRKKELKKELNGLVSRARSWLNGRGQRCGGTHTSWQKGVDGNPDLDWYKPFSMAKDSEVTSRGNFPFQGAAGKEEIAKKIQSYVEAFWGIG